MMEHATLRNCVILLAEDNADDLMLICRAFEKSNRFQVQSVRNGAEFIAYLEGTGPYANRTAYPLPQLAMLDLHLPGRNGIEILQWLRHQPGLRRLPVIVFSGHTDPNEVIRAAEAGANSFITKPVNFGELVQKLVMLQDYWSKVEFPAITVESTV